MLTTSTYPGWLGAVVKHLNTHSRQRMQARTSTKTRLPGDAELHLNAEMRLTPGNAAAHLNTQPPEDAGLHLNKDTVA